MFPEFSKFQTCETGCKGLFSTKVFPISLIRSTMTISPTATRFHLQKIIKDSWRSRKRTRESEVQKNVLQAESISIDRTWSGVLVSLVVQATYTGHDMCRTTCHQECVSNPGST